MRASIKLQYIYTGSGNQGGVFTVGNNYEVLDIYSPNGSAQRFLLVDDTGKVVFTTNGLTDDGGIYWSVVKVKVPGPSSTDIILFPLS